MTTEIRNALVTWTFDWLDDAFPAVIDDDAFSFVSDLFTKLHEMGLRVVPAEATRQQIAAADELAVTSNVNSSLAMAEIHGCMLKADFTGPGNTPLERWYRAMIAAAPDPLAPDQE